MTWSIIHSYSRKQALSDGVLVEIPPDLAAEAGFRVPVACTRAVWEDCVAWGEADTRRTGAPQDQTGRLWDLLTMTRHAASRAADEGRARVELTRVPRDGRSPEPQLTRLTAVMGPGDDGQPVLTILEQGEE